MITTIISDISYVILFPKDPTYTGTLNGLYKKHFQDESFNFFDYFKLNKELLDYYESLKNNLDLFIFTSDIIQDDPSLNKKLINIFKDIYSASRMNTNKSEPEAFKLLIKKINKTAEEVLFVDDTEKNIIAASDAGLKTIHYKNNEQVKEAIAKII